MGKTFAEKILAVKSGDSSISSGDIVEVSPDVAMSHDNTAAISKIFNGLGVKNVFDPDVFVVILDHCSPPADEKYAQNHQIIRKFVKDQRIKNFYDINAGICHQILPERGHIKPGDLVLGSDSHTTTHGAFGAFATGIGRSEMAVIYATGKIWLRVPESYRIVVNGKLPPGVGAKDLILRIIGDLGADGALYRSVEFSGETIENMSLSGRMVLCNMVVEMGAKNGYIKSDEKVESFLAERGVTKSYSVIVPDKDAEYERTLEYDVSQLEPQVACPHTVDNVKPLREVEGIRMDQAILGTCTNGRMEDLREAAEILEGNQVHKNVRLLVFPASWEIYLRALREGIIEILAGSGGVIMNPGCGPCLGAHEGVLAPGEVCISTANRNFKGRMGCKDAEIYLASPATVATSAIAGEIRWL